MKISIIGNGNVGQGLARGLKNAGHDVSTTGNDLLRTRDLAMAGDVNILAVPFGALDQVAATIGSAADGKPLVDVTNTVTTQYTLALGYKASGAEELQKKLPGTRVVKAFNTVFAGTMDPGQVKGERLTAFVTSDDAEAKAPVQDLALGLGFDAVDAGPLSSARLLEPMGFLNIQLGFVLGLGSEIGLKLVR